MCNEIKAVEDKQIENNPDRIERDINICLDHIDSFVRYDCTAEFLELKDKFIDEVDRKVNIFNSAKK